ELGQCPPPTHPPRTGAGARRTQGIRSGPAARACKMGGGSTRCPERPRHMEPPLALSEQRQLRLYRPRDRGEVQLLRARPLFLWPTGASDSLQRTVRRPQGRLPSCAKPMSSVFALEAIQIEVFAAPAGARAA